MSDSGNYVKQRQIGKFHKNHGETQEIHEDSQMEKKYNTSNFNLKEDNIINKSSNNNNNSANSDKFPNKTNRSSNTLKVITDIY